MIPYLQVENLSKNFGELILFEDISFSIHKDQKVAIIAKNGTGKTSLLNIITELDTADSGIVTQKNDITIGYLQQNPKFDENKTALEQVFSSSNKIIETIKNYNTAINSADEKQMQQAIEKMDFQKAWDYETKIKQILFQLKITNLQQKVGELSGGQKKRLAIANLLINQPDLLILDEPTNHLDLELIEWLENYMEKTRSTILMVTHDRYFLDRICTDIIEIEDNTVYKYKGNYSYYLQKRSERIELANVEVEKAKNLYKKELEWARRMPKARTTKAKYRIENVDKLQKKATNKNIDQKLEIGIQTRRIGKKILELYDISKSFGKLKLFEDFSYKFTDNEKIGIVGKNGSGKTTFLNVLTDNLKSDTGKIDKGQTIVYGFYKQQGIKIDEKKRIIDVINDIADVIVLGNGSTLSSAQFLDYFLFPRKMHFNRVEKLSGGERRRLYLMTVLMKNPNFLILDEPTNDLDIMTLNVLEDYLLNFRGCVIIVSHDRYFMDKVVDTLFIFEDDTKIKSFVGKYSDYYFSKKQQEKKQKKIEKQNKPKKEKLNKPKPKKLTYKNKLIIEAIEKELPKLEKEKQELEAELNSGTLLRNEISEKAKKLSELENQIDEKEMIWLEITEEVGD